MRPALAFFVLFISAFVSACGGGNADLAQRVEALERENIQRVSDVTALQTENTILKRQLSLLEFGSTWNDTAYLTPGDAGYSLLNFDLGKLTVQISDVTPYANGSKVVLTFGNLTSSKVQGLKAKVEWGKVAKDSGLPMEESAKTREVSFNEELRAGAWTKTEVVLEGLPPADLGFVRVGSAGHRGVLLSR